MSYKIVTPLACRELTHSRPCVGIAIGLLYRIARLHRQCNLFVHAVFDFVLKSTSLSIGSGSVTVRVVADMMYSRGEFDPRQSIILAENIAAKLAGCRRLTSPLWPSEMDHRHRLSDSTLGAHRMIGRKVGRGDDVPPRRLFSTDTGHPSISLLTYCLLRHHHRRFSSVRSDAEAQNVHKITRHTLVAKFCKISVFFTPLFIDPWNPKQGTWLRPLTDWFWWSVLMSSHCCVSLVCTKCDGWCAAVFFSYFFRYLLSRIKI